MQQSFFINKDYNPIILRTILRRHWLWFSIILAFFFSLAFFYLRYTKSIYESTTLIQIAEQDQGKELLEIENINTKDDISEEIELLRSELLFNNALDKLKMNVSIFAQGNILSEERYLNSGYTILPFQIYDSAICDVPIFFKNDGKNVILDYSLNGSDFNYKVPINVKSKTKHFEFEFVVNDFNYFSNDCEDNDLYFAFNSRRALIERLLPNLVVEGIDANAKTISISFKGPNALLCHDVTNAVTDAFFNFDQTNKQKSAENILVFIDQQLDSIGEILNIAKDSLNRYVRSSGLRDPESTTSSGDDIDRYQDELFRVEEELQVLNSLNSKLKTDPNRLEIYRLIPDILGKSYEQSLSTQITELNHLLEKKEELLADVSENNSEIKLLNNRIQTKVTFIRKSIDIIQNRLESNARVLRSRLGLMEGELLSLPQKKMEYGRIKSAQDINKKFYDILSEKKVLYSISNAGYTSNNRILSPASYTATPVSPNRKLIYAGFLFIGLIIGLIYLLYRYVTFNEVNTIDDLKSLLPEKVTVLGGVPLLKNTMEYSQLMVHESPKSMLAESMRNIRTNLSFVSPNMKTIAVSSSISGEGKTFISLNLAGIIALSDKKCVIIDLDLRKPKIHLGLNTENIAGISNLIIGQCTVDEVIRKSEIDNLDFITAGPVPPNPSELILSAKMDEILEELKSKYDVVIIDNPPVGIVTDGVRILANADVPIYIFKSNYSKRIFAQRVNELFELNQISQLNVIMNGTDVSRSKYGYGGYGYGYGYGYYDDDKKSSKKRKKK